MGVGINLQLSKKIDFAKGILKNAKYEPPCNHIFMVVVLICCNIPCYYRLQVIDRCRKFPPFFSRQKIELIFMRLGGSGASPAVMGVH